MIPEEIQLAEAIRKIETSIGTGQRLLCVQAWVDEALAAASQRRSSEREASIVLLSKLSAYAESLVASANVPPPVGERLLFSGVRPDLDQQHAAFVQRISDAAEAARHIVSNLKTSQAQNVDAFRENESFEDLQQELDQALLDDFGSDAGGIRQFCLVETFPDHVIVRGPDGDLYQISYTVGQDDAITFGDPQEVETLYVPVAQAAQFLVSEAATEDGWSWPVRMLEAGWAQGRIADANGQIATPHYFPSEIVAKVAEAANGARFRKRHPETGDGSDAPELTAGWLSNTKMSGTSALATVNLLKSETEIRSKLMAARDAGKLDLFGVSILAYFGFRRSTVEGKSAMLATSLQKFVGLDLCAEPGAGGRFLQGAAS
jgi:hypothetical protein